MIVVAVINTMSDGEPEDVRDAYSKILEDNMSAGPEEFMIKAYDVPDTDHDRWQLRAEIALDVKHALRELGVRVDD